MTIDAPVVRQWSPMSKSVELRFGNTPVIDNRWDYPADSVEKLRHALYDGVVARPDPSRSAIYEVEADGSVYYIHISPISRRVMLLAIWDAR